MKTLTAKDAKYGFGRLIDLVRAEPVLIAKHGRPVVVVMAVEASERLKALDKPAIATLGGLYATGCLRHFRHQSLQRNL
jgi:prevent-host-death family protein